MRLNFSIIWHESISWKYIGQIWGGGGDGGDILKDLQKFP